MVESFGIGSLSEHRSFPRKRESSPSAAHFQWLAEWIPAFVGMTAPGNGHGRQMTRAHSLRLELILSPRLWNLCPSIPKGPTRLVVPEGLAETALYVEGSKLDFVEFGEGDSKHTASVARRLPRDGRSDSSLALRALT